MRRIFLGWRGCRREIKIRIEDESGEFGSLTHYDYGFRIYNPGIGKFLSVDPLAKSYPMLTPYQFASNRPIDGIDLDGLEYLDHRKSFINIWYGSIVIKLENVSNPTQHYFTTFNSLQSGRTNKGAYMKMKRPLELKTNINNFLPPPAPRFAQDGLAGPRRSFVEETYPIEKRMVYGDNSNTKLARKSFRAGDYQIRQSQFKPSVPSGKAPIFIYAIGKFVYHGTSSFIEYEIEKAEEQQKKFGVTSLEHVVAESISSDFPNELRNSKYISEIANYVLQGTLLDDDLSNEKRSLIINTALDM